MYMSTQYLKLLSKKNGMYETGRWLETLLRIFPIVGRVFIHIGTFLFLSKHSMSQSFFLEVLCLNFSPGQKKLNI